MAYGGVRDLVLGVRLALADGRVIKAGGKVVKNVAGYDMPKLVIGSLGTIGIVTEVSLRLHPLPADRRTLLFGFADSGSAIAAAESILNSELLPAAVTILSPAAALRLETPGTASLAVALEETVENNAYQADRLSRMIQPPETLTGEGESNFWDRLINFGDRFGKTFRLRVNTLVSDLAEHLEAPDMEGIAYAASGTVILYGMADGMSAGETLRSRMGRACAAGGSAVLECGPIQLRRQVDVWGSMRPEWKFTHGIRRTFDPALILNRGRYVGGV
jgi:glycolate oxidase FAD binding subunit